MYGLFAAHDAACNFDGAVRDHLIHIHVGLRAAAGLPNAQREVIVEAAGNDFLGGLDDERGLIRWELAKVLVHQRGGFFEDAESADQLGRHGVLANGEMDERAGGLRAVVAIGGDVDFAHAVRLGASHDGCSVDSFSHGSSWDWEAKYYLESVGRRKSGRVTRRAKGRQHWGGR